MKVFFKKGVRPQLLPKRGRTSIKKERRNMRADCRARENRRRGDPAPQGDGRIPTITGETHRGVEINNANVFKKMEIKSPTLPLGMTLLCDNMCKKSIGFRRIPH